MKKLITFEVDSSALFDGIADIGDGGEAVGVRLAGVLLDPKSVFFSTRVALELYGIAIKSVTDAPSDAPSTTEADR